MTVDRPASAAGWYPDPWRQAPVRWWDGRQWTPYLGGPPPPPRSSPPPATFAAAALPIAVGGIVVTVVVARLLSSVAFPALGAPDWLKLAVFYVEVFGGLYATCRLASRRHGTGSVRRDYGVRWRPMDLVWCVAAFFAARWLQVLVLLGFSGQLDKLSRLVEGAEHVSTAAFVVFAVSAVIGAPIFEELCFRGLLQRSLTARTSRWVAIAVQGLAFGAYHTVPELGWTNVPYVLSLSCFGFAAGFLADRTRRLGGGMSTHFVNNMLSVIVIAVRR